MAKVLIDTKIWENYFSVESGLCYLWLLTNDRYTNILGCYRFSKRRISCDTGLSYEQVEHGLEQLCEEKLIVLDGDEVLIVYKCDEWNTSKTYIARLKKELNGIKSNTLATILTERLSHLINKKVVTDKTRIEVYKKYGGRCAYCGNLIDINTFEVDHIIPKYNGGQNIKSNYNPSCHHCNMLKLNRDLQTFRVLLWGDSEHKFFFEECANADH